MHCVVLVRPPFAWRQDSWEQFAVAQRPIYHMDVSPNRGLQVGAIGLLLLSGSVGRAAYLESGSATERDEIEPRIIAPRPPPRPRDDAVSRLVRSLRVGEVVHSGPLLVFPLYVDRGTRSGVIRTMDEALGRGRLDIREAGSARVPRLEVRNRDRNYVFLMSGEVIAGGKQNRMVQHDVLLPPRSEVIRVPVYCVERDRWTDSAAPFRAGRVLAYPALRRKAASAESQESIWQSIDRCRRDARVKSSTGDYLDLTSSPALVSRLDRVARHLRPVLTRRSVGAVAMIGNQVVACDIFSDPQLFARLWPKICRSYGTQVGGTRADGRHDDATRRWSPRGRDIARRLLDRALTARREDAHTPGAGYRLRLSGSAEGGALIWNDQVVHASFWPGRAWKID
jgi:hypothetical protein